MLPSFGTFGPAAPKEYAAFLGQVADGVGNWKTAGEFRAWVVLTHEVVHYLQDIATGVGHWDSVKQRDALRTGLECARFASWLEGPPPPYSVHESDLVNGVPATESLSTLRLAYASAQSDLLVVPAAAQPVERVTALRERFSEVASADASEEFVIESLLEAEAAAATARQVGDMRADDLRSGIADDNRSLWDPDHMEAPYSDLVRGFLAVVLHVYGDDWERLAPTEFGELVKLGTRLMGLLTDLACAHPSPWLVSNRGLDTRDYEPGLKYARLVNAFANMRPEDYGTLFAALRERDLTTAESVLLLHCVHEYVRADEVYGEWLTRLEELEGDEANRRIALRRVCTQIRLESPGAFIDKSLDLLWEHRLPLSVLGPEGLWSVGSRWEDVDTALKLEFVDALLAHNMDMASLHHLLVSGRLTCPLALARVCNSAGPECRGGIQELNELPASPGCSVRYRLAKAGFNVEE